MRFHFRSVKDVGSTPLYWLMRTTANLPAGLHRAFFSALGLPVKAYYWVPGSLARRTFVDLCLLAGRSDPRQLYFRLVDNVAATAAMSVAVWRGGVEAAAAMCAIEDSSLSRLKAAKEKYGGGIVVIPHNIGSVLAGVGLGMRFPVVALVRESKSERRAQIMRECYSRLSRNSFLFARRDDPGKIARGILRALHDGKFVMAATDNPRRIPDTVGVKFLGQTVALALWPARFSARREAPIIPCYARMESGHILITCDEPYLEKDMTVATQRWAGCFEKNILAYPADWGFTLDRRWSRIIAAAARARRREARGLSSSGQKPNAVSS